MTNRYQDLLDGGPRGGEWKTRGPVLPYQTAPHEFVYDTAVQVTSGTAAGGAPSSITLAATATGVTLPARVELTGGRGEGQERAIAIYNGATQLATVSPAWSVQPDTTTTYVVYTTRANRRFRVFLNGGLRPDVMTNALGRALIYADGGVVNGRVAPLPAGAVTIEIEDTVTGTRARRFRHVKHLGTILAAHAEVLEDLDDGIEAFREAKAVETASSLYLEDVHGRRVRQTDDLGDLGGGLAPTAWVLDSYRRVVKWLYQTYRNWAGRLLGLRQGTSGIAGALPFVLPRAWKPHWVPGTSGVLGSALHSDQRTRLASDAELELPNLNARCFTWVHAAYPPVWPAADAFPFATGPVTLPRAQRLVVSFSAGWDGGPVTVTGTQVDAGATIAVSESFTPPAPIPGAMRIEGVQTFAIVTGATKSGGTVGTASIGVEDRFVSLPSPSGFSNDVAVTGAPSSISLAGALPSTLQWGTGPGETLAASFQGTMDLHALSARSWAYLAGLQVEPFVPGSDLTLRLEADRRGPLDTELAAPFTAANIAALVNTTFRRSLRYGALPATGSITVVAHSAAPPVFPTPPPGPPDTFTLNDGILPALTFEYTDGVWPPAPANVEIAITPGWTAESVRDATIAAIRAQLGNAVGYVRITARPDPTAPGLDVVLLTAADGGVQGNQPILSTVAHPGFAVAGMAGGADSAYGTLAAAVGAAPLGPLVELLRPVAPFTTRSVRVHAAPADAAGTVFGLPRRSGALTATALANATHLAIGAHGLPEISAEAGGLLWPALLDTAPGGWGTALRQPASPAALAVVFAAGWAGGVVTVTGTNAAGTTVADTFTYAGPGAEVVTGALGVAFRTVATATKAVVAPGPAVHGAWIGPSTEVSDPARGTWIRVGRGLRVTSGGAANGQLAPLSDGRLAIFTTAGAPLYAGITGDCAVRITGAIDPRSNGIFPGYVAGGGALFDVTNPDPGSRFGGPEAGLDWDVYHEGSLVRVVWADPAGGPGTLTVAPTSRAFAVGTERVEDAAEMPVTAGGQDDPDYVTVGVDTTYAPTAGFPVSDPVTPTGRTGVPDAWSTTNVTETASLLSNGYLVPTRLTLTAPAAAPSVLWRDVPELLTYRGLPVRLRAWVQQHDAAASNIAVTVDFGVSVVSFGAPVAVPGTYVDGVTGLGPLEPVVVGGVAEVPPTATQAVLQITYTAPAPGARWTIETVYGTLAVAGGVGGAGGGAGTWGGGMVRNPHRENFGEVIWIWSPAGGGGSSGLIQGEARGLGLPLVADATSWSGWALGPDGHVPNLLPAHAVAERFELTAGAGATPAPGAPGAGAGLVRGCYDEITWGTSTRTNLEIVLGTPAKTTYLRPIHPTEAAQRLAFTAPSNAATDEVSMHLDAANGGVWRPVWNGLVVAGDVLADGTPLVPGQTLPPEGALRLAGAYPHGAFGPDADYGDDAVERVEENQELTVPSDGFAAGAARPWRWIGPSTVQFASLAVPDPPADVVYPDGTPIYDPASSYVLVYRRLTRVTTAVIDLGASYVDYLWLVDLAIHRRVLVTAESVEATNVGLTFDVDGRARLEVPSDGDAASASITRDTGIAKTTVPAARWRFESDNIVLLDVAELDADSVYRISYNRRVGRRRLTCERLGELVLEHRSGVDGAACITATWAIVTLDRVVHARPVAGAPAIPGHRYHQLRLTLDGITDTSDIEIQSLGLRGVNLFGAVPYAPGMVV